MEYTIETDIPMPAAGYARQKPALQKALESLPVGGSVFVNPDEPKYAYLSRWVAGMQGKLGMRFTIRTVNGGRRIWRKE